MGGWKTAEASDRIIARVAANAIDSPSLSMSRGSNGERNAM